MNTCGQCEHWNGSRQDGLRTITEHVDVRGDCTEEAGPLYGYMTRYDESACIWFEAFTPQEGEGTGE